MKLATPRERLLTPDEVAEQLGVSTGTLSVWRCLKRVPLPYIKIGRAVRYSPQAVAAFIESRTESCEAVPA